MAGDNYLLGAVEICRSEDFTLGSRIYKPGKKVFDDNADRDFFVDWLGLILSDTSTQCFAWVLIPNYFHLLLKTGTMPIVTVMKRLLTGYAMHYNRRHKPPVSGFL